eukprot:766289-Hanusia_phi.AAC.8
MGIHAQLGPSCGQDSLGLKGAGRSGGEGGGREGRAKRRGGRGRKRRGGEGTGVPSSLSFMMRTYGRHQMRALEKEEKDGEGGRRAGGGGVGGGDVRVGLGGIGSVITTEEEKNWAEKGKEE